MDMRAIGISLLIAIAILFTVLTITFPLTLRSQAADDRVYYEQFKQAAAFVAKTGQLPTRDKVSAWGWPSNSPLMSLNLGPADCDGAFEKESSDRFVLGFWRGEWFECYAYPSGKTSMPMSVKAYLLSGLGFDLSLFALIAGAASYVAVGLWKGKRRGTRT